MGDEISKAILAEYDLKSSSYDAFGKSVADLIQRLLQTERIEHLPIERRTKDRVSVADKLVRPDKAGKYNHLSDLTDIAGVRVVAFLHEDCERVCQIIEQNFDIDYANSTRKLDDLDPDRFGYTSIHYIASHAASRLDWPEFADFAEMRAEIQIRTVLQHSWAAIDWKLRYKSKVEVPIQLRRRLHRISALLEAADSEFSAIALSADRIRSEYKARLDENKFDIPIDADSISLFIGTSAWLTKLVARARKNKLEIYRIPQETHGRVASLIYSLESGGFQNLADVNNLIKKDQAAHISNLKMIFEDWIRESETPTLSVETMIRVLAIMSRPKKIAIEMINAAPMNLTLGDVLRRKIAEKPD